MRFCQDHWDRLRAAIEDRGMGDLIADSGERAVVNLERELTDDKTTLATFDPLMGAHWAIATNAMTTIERAGGSPLYLMASDEVPEAPVDPERYAEANGRTWPRCPLCYLGLAHELTCTEPGCKLPKVDGYAWMIDRAADDQVATWEKLKADA